MSNTASKNEARWLRHYNALIAYLERTGHTRVPGGHIERVGNDSVGLGAWVSYVRQRHRAGLLSPERAESLSGLPGWQWGPLRPGPLEDAARNEQIIAMRQDGMSLRAIGDAWGLSRQRVHQIVTQFGEDAAA